MNVLVSILWIIFNLWTSCFSYYLLLLLNLIFVYIMWKTKSMLNNILNIYCKNIFNNFLIAESCRTRTHLFQKLQSPAPAPAPESWNAPVLHSPRVSNIPKCILNISWKPPVDPFVTLNTDDSTLGNKKLTWEMDHWILFTYRLNNE